MRCKSGQPSVFSGFVQPHAAAYGQSAGQESA